MVRVWDLAGPPALAMMSRPRQQRQLQRRRGPAGGGRVEGAIWLVDLADAVSTVVEGPAAADEPTDRRGVRPGGSMADGYMLASAHLNGQVRVSGTLDRVAWAEDTLLGHKEVATALAFDAAGQIASGSYDGEVLWWSAARFVGVGEAFPWR